jgi:WD40 repeat protein
VGSTDLRLYQTDPEMILLWKRELSSPASLAEFSPDAGLIATVARYDRLVKLWRRLSYGSDDVRFDFSYLSHPSTVTRLHWRTSSNSEARTENILYTVCTDNKVRIWSAMELHGSQVLQLWTEIDVLQSIQPRYLNPSQNHERYVLFIDGHDFSKAVAAAQEDTTQNAHRQQRDALEYLADISKRNPEVCVVFDSQGHMSAWGVETVGSRDRTANQVFNFAHVEDCNIIQGQTAAGPLAECIRFISFCTVGPEVKFATLVHYFDGRIVWMEGRIDELFDPSPGRARLHAKALWTGHQGSVKKVMRTIDGQALMSRTNDNEGIIWKQRHGKDGMALSRQSLLNSYEHIHRTWLIDDGQTTANLHHESLSVWNTASFEAEEIGRCKYQLEGKPLCLLQLPTPDSQTISRFLATISSRMKGIVWELRFPENSLTGVKRDNASRPILSELCTFDLGLEIDLAFVVPVDPAGSAPIVSGFLDTFAKDVAISYTKNGVFHTWAAKVDPMTRSVDWLLTSTVETGIDHPFLASGSSIRKIALVNSSRNGLSIWDSRSNQLEYDMEYNVQDMICDLDWTSTPDEQSILAVGFPHKVVILAQVRYDYIDKGAAWAPIREIYIRESTPHPIGDSVWLGSGNLVIGAGTQLFVYDKLVTTSDSMITELSVPAYGRTLVDLFEVVSAINGPLPLYHPQFLSQCILAGKLALVSKILVILNKSLKFSTEDHVNSLLGLSIQDLVEDDQVCSCKILFESLWMN